MPAAVVQHVLCILSVLGDTHGSLGKGELHQGVWDLPRTHYASVSAPPPSDHLCWTLAQGRVLRKVTHGLGTLLSLS